MRGGGGGGGGGEGGEEHSGHKTNHTTVEADSSWSLTVETVCPLSTEEVTGNSNSTSP